MTALNGKKILLVEDDTFICDLYKTVLLKSGYNVIVVGDGEAALKIVEDNQFDLILLDIMLPKVTGLEVLKEYKKEGSSVANVPIYLLTNLGEENIIKEAYRLGASGYLLKAKYLPKQIVSEVDSFFGIKSSTSE